MPSHTPNASNSSNSSNAPNLPKPPSSKALYFRLLSYVRPYWVAFAASVFCMGLSSVVEPIFPAMMKNLLDNGFSQDQASWNWLLYPLGILALFLARAILGFLGDYAMSWVSNHVISNLRKIMFEKIVELPTSYFNDHTSGRLMSRVTYDVGNVTGAATGALTIMIKDSLSIVGLLGWLLYLNWQLTLITLLMIPFIAVVMKSFGKRLGRVARNIQESQGTLTEVLQESIEGHKVVKIFGGQAYEVNRFVDTVQKQRRFNMRGTIAAAAQGPIVQFFAAIALAVIMAIALRQASSEQTSVGGFVSFITAMLMMLAPIKRLTDISAPIHRGLAAAESVFGIIDEPQEPDEGSIDLGEAKGLVEFDQVRFAYPGANKDVLKGVSFSVSPGECVALVGSSGGGKTTIANLLPRFYPVEEGQIRIDHHPLNTIGLASLRKNIALVSQEVILFNDTVAANIAYGQAQASKEAIIEAAKAAYAFDFIEAMPNGFDTLIGENGVKLSGGQRQRIAIARALLKNAPILILDEATSALDSESECYVQAALTTLMKGRSTVVIAHRLSTIENADRILVVQRGKITESGTHHALLAANGAYAKLRQIQSSEEHENEAN